MQAERESRVGAAVRALGVLAAVVAIGAAPAMGAGHRHRHHHHHHHRHHHRNAHLRPTYAPPKGKVFHGVTETRLGVPDVKLFQQQVGDHPAVLEDFYHWDTPLTSGALDRWRASQTRGILSLSTGPGGEPGQISPGQIARGLGDEYMVELSQSIAESGQVVYIRLMPEMNGSWNRYSAYSANGHARNANHSTKVFRAAWRRFSIIVRGGSVKSINKRLLALKMPRLTVAKSSIDPVYRPLGTPSTLGDPKVALIWNPQTISSPNIAGNQPQDYWPGKKYVDWVGADIYSKYATPGVRTALSKFYAGHRGVPFMIGEYSPWDNDVNGSFVRWLFRWAKQHDRTRMLVYYRSVYALSPFDIANFAKARAALRDILDSRRYMQYAPGTRHPGH
jgi:hypothetical protein